ncbi:hypothetical protein CRG98_043973 [Punica granatum]|uniref:Secreted protein n=1 Tax=Punica granatum TaxID=22663 RepID=A0A2I0HWJ7_PUNGR|nr:hypothetical protein CRG98_043973 [Punica granatum]
MTEPGRTPIFSCFLWLDFSNSLFIDTLAGPAPGALQLASVTCCLLAPTDQLEFVVAAPRSCYLLCCFAAPPLLLWRVWTIVPALVKEFLRHTWVL